MEYPVKRFKVWCFCPRCKQATKHLESHYLFPIILVCTICKAWRIAEVLI